METRRLKRIGVLLKKEVDEIIKLRLKDPRIKGLISIVDVEVSPDIKNATVYVSIYGIPKEAANETIIALKNAANHIKFILGKRLRLKYIPNLNFILDNSLERGARILQILDEIAKENMEMDLQK